MNIHVPFVCDEDSRSSEADNTSALSRVETIVTEKSTKRAVLDIILPDYARTSPLADPSPSKSASHSATSSSLYRLPSLDFDLSSVDSMSFGGFTTRELTEDSRQHTKPPPTWSNTGTPLWPTSARPLSDIRELTEPSLIELSHKNLLSENGIANVMSRKNSLRRKDSTRTDTSRRQPLSERRLFDNEQEDSSSIRSPDHSPNDRSSLYSVPTGSIPLRSSSHQQRAQYMQVKPSSTATRQLTGTIPNRGRSRSPVKEIASRYDPVTSDHMRRAPSRTFVRASQSNDVLESPIHRHPRVSAELHVSASLFVGGSSIEGSVRVVVDHAERSRHRRALAIARISVDLIGAEETFSPLRRSIFLNLAQELIDTENPPPHQMVESLKQISPVDPFWLLAPSTSVLPFLISLPLDVGPPPFQSKYARIRYILCVTLLIRDAGRQYLVRASQEVTVLSVYDPEKALMSLPSPLTASDEYIKAREVGPDIVRVTAGLHRQVWVSGTTMFVDVHIVNSSKRTIKRLDLQLERDLLCYKHVPILLTTHSSLSSAYAKQVAASTMEKSASQARIFDSNERVMLSKATVKQGQNGWNGVPPHATDIRTCDIELPRGHATVKCGKYFEVRFFLNVIAGTSHRKLVSIQLPVVLIHMNSLDVVPNSVAQVAAAIEEKRHLNHSYQASEQQRLERCSSRTVQGRAFAAPRLQSLGRMQTSYDDLRAITREFNSTPHRYPDLRPVRSTWSFQTPPSNRKGRLLRMDDVEGLKQRLRRVASTKTTRTTNTMPTGSAAGAVVRSVRSERSLRRHAASALGFRGADVHDADAAVIARDTLQDHHARSVSSYRPPWISGSANCNSASTHQRAARSNTSNPHHQSEHSQHYHKPSSTTLHKRQISCDGVPKLPPTRSTSAMSTSRHDRDPTTRNENDKAKAEAPHIRPFHFDARRRRSRDRASQTQHARSSNDSGEEEYYEHSRPGTSASHQLITDVKAKPLQLIPSAPNRSGCRYPPTPQKSSIARPDGAGNTANSAATSSRWAPAGWGIWDKGGGASEKRAEEGGSRGERSEKQRMMENWI